MRCFQIIQEHKHIMCSCSGGSDSDVMVDMLLRCGAKDKTDFIFFNTGLEYAATFKHIRDLEQKYGIKIYTESAYKSIPTCVKEYGVPFWGKFASEMIYRLQRNNFQWEDEPFDTLIQRYPTCKTALKWWCNVTKGKTDQYAIKRAPYLKEFIIKNPPTFKISNKCCTYAKKKPALHFAKNGRFDLTCIGIRQSENGARANVHMTCFSEAESTNTFRPIFWFRESDKEEYCEHYGIIHSECYTKYGLLRTGCFGCPFGKRFEEELKAIEAHEPKLLQAANNVFGESYDYTRRYLSFREEMGCKRKNW